MRVLFSGGASGGHVNPALAIADIIKANYPDSEIAFVGTPYGIENSIVPQAGYKLYKIKIEGVNGKKGLGKLKAYARAFTAQFSAKRVSSIQLLSRVRLFTTPWTAARQASLSITNSRNSPRFTSVESVMPSSYLITICEVD